MLRYVALVWDPVDIHSQTLPEDLRRRLLQSSEDWHCPLSQPGLALFVLRSPFHCYDVHTLGDRAGAVLGLLFDRRDPNRNSARHHGPYFDQLERKKILATQGRHLITDYWGRYVAFLSDVATATRRVLRDPIGDLPCYRATIDHVSVYFSFLPDLLQLRCLKLSVDWRHLAFRVITGDAWADESALAELEAVRAGECIEHSGARVHQHSYWHPHTIARSSPIEDGAAAAAELRSAAKASVHAWASLHANVVHILSGGLDSSIVLACLADAPSRPDTQVSCLNFRTRDPDSDERPYARLAAAQSGYELFEQERTTTLALQNIFTCTPTVGPTNLVMRGLEVQPLIAQFAHSRSASAVFSGDGGDMLFFRGWPQLAIIDRAYQHGLNRQLLRFAADAALPAQLSVPKLLYDAVRYGTLGRKWDIRHKLFEHYRLVTDAVVARAWRELDLLNPWNCSTAGLPPGKLFHAFSVTRCSVFRDPLPDQAALDMINPLVSQPLVEACLRIPTYIHAAGGGDRVVARAAFTPDLPRQILLRTWKGAADRRQRDLLADNIDFVRELLLDGELVKQGILDRARLETALAGAPVVGATHATEIFGYVCAEAWLAHWPAYNATTTPCSPAP